MNTRDIEEQRSSNTMHSRLTRSKEQGRSSSMSSERETIVYLDQFSALLMGIVAMILAISTWALIHYEWNNISPENDWVKLVMFMTWLGILGMGLLLLIAGADPPTLFAGTMMTTGGVIVMGTFLLARALHFRLRFTRGSGGATPPNKPGGETRNWKLHQVCQIVRRVFPPYVNMWAVLRPRTA